MTDIDKYFDESFGFLVLFVMIIGFLGDVVIHLGANHTKWFAQGLKPYYKSMEYGKSKLLGWILSGLAGGIACVIGLVFGQLLLYAKEQ